MCIDKSGVTPCTGLQVQGVSVVGSEIRKNYAAIEAAAASPPVMASPVPVPVAAPVASAPVVANVPEQAAVSGQAIATAPAAQATETSGAPNMAPGAAPSPLVSALPGSSSSAFLHLHATVGSHAATASAIML